LDGGSAQIVIGDFSKRPAAVKSGAGQFTSARNGSEFSQFVMPGLDPDIHLLCLALKWIAGIGVL
jgi:hypothetical protein